MTRVLGDALVRVRPDTSGFAGDTQRGIAPGLKKAAGVIAGALSARAVGAGASAVVKASSNAQQSIGATEQVFKKYADTVVARSNKASTAIGISANEYRELSNVTGAMLKSSGMPLAKVTDLTDKLNVRAADMAATFGGTTKEALEAVTSLLRGETDPIERYGVSLKQSDITARLAAKGQNKLTGAALKQAEAQARLDLLFKQTSASQGQSARESGQYAGVTQRLSARFDDLQVKIGNALLPAFTSIATVLADKAMPKLDQLADEYLPKISDAVAGFVQDLDFEQIGTKISGALDGVDWGQIQSTFAGIARDGGKLKPLLSDLASQLPGINDLFSVTGEVVGFAADHTDLLAKALPYLVYGYAAVKAGQLAANVATLASVPLRIAELVTTRAYTKALQEQTVAMGVNRAATAASTGATNVGVVATLRARLAAVGTAIAQKVAAGATRVWAAAQWLLNAAMKANPIAKVITVLSLLGAGLVLAYRKSETFRNIVDGAWKMIRTGISAAWGFIQPVLSAIASWVGSRLPKVFGVLRGIASGVFGALGRGISAVWKNVISPVFEALKGGIRVVRTVFGGVVDGIGKVFDKLKGIVMTPIKWVIDNVINKLIDGVNNVYDALIPGKDNKLIGRINLSGPAARTGEGKASGAARNKLAGGGPVPGRSPNPRADNIPIWATAREFMVKQKSAIRMDRRHPGVLDYINRNGALPGYAGGGRVRPLTGATPSPSYAGHTGVDLNAPNDFGKPILAAADGVVSLVKHLKTSYGNYVMVRHGGGIQTLYAHMSKTLAKVGQQVKAGQAIGKVGSTGNSTGPHLHFEVRPGGSYAASMAFLKGAKNIPYLQGGGDGFNPVGAIRGTISAIAKTVRGGAGLVGELGKGALKTLGGAALRWAKSKVQAEGKVVGADTSSLTPQGKGGTQAAARAALANYGWGQDQWAPLKALWQKESGWNPLATNKSSGAYGIPQALPGSKMASAGKDWRTNPLTQIQWGLGYIRDRYGSPAKAWAHSGRTGWYADGGRIRDMFDRGGIAKSAGFLTKGTVKPERVLSPKQTQLFDRLVAALDANRLSALEQLTRDQARETRRLKTSRRFKAMDAKGQKDALTDLAERQKKKRQDTRRSLVADQRQQLTGALGVGVQLGKFLSAGFAKGLAGNREQVAARFEPVMAAVAKVGDKRLTELATRARAAVLKVAGDYEAAVARTAAAREALASLRETAASYTADLAKNGVDSGDIATSTDTSLPGIVAFLKDAAVKVTGRTDLTARLSKAGLSPNAIAQIVAEGGSRSQSVADSILAGGPAAIKKVNDLMAQLQTASAAYGRTASAAVYGAQIRASEATVAALKAAEGPLVAQMTQLGRSMVRALSAQLPGANAVTKKNLAKLLAGVGTGKPSSKVKTKLKGKTISKSSTFDDGGLARGIGDLSKRTVRPERVLSGRQTDIFEAWLASGPGKPKGGDVTIQQHFPTTATPRAAADAAGGRVVDALSAVGITRKP